ncbi:MAG: sugar phosphate nucleotidyltransferase [Candidatus Marinimicrobia bacterium]|nr:sugar phosphate nucleotidyltransferase [Candidatus Neomarinimicrobiota bacterium]
MNNVTLMVMAAGMGSRYGGLKQLDSVGPNGETIIDYSVYDAIEAGYNKVVFIIRKDFENDFKSKITAKYTGKIEVGYAYQNIDDLPNGYTCPEGRVKPWGTGHAILSAVDQINGPVCVINADDFYGRESFKELMKFYTSGNNGFSMVAFHLDQTLSSSGGVTRGICEVMNDKLSSVNETSNIQKIDNCITSEDNVEWEGKELVSMNMWGFTPVLFNYLKEMFLHFLNEKGEEIDSEFLIPTVINDLIQNGRETVQVLRSNSLWFGVTYKEDKPYVVEAIQKLITSGKYPQKLFE